MTICLSRFMCTMYVQGSLEIRGTCWNPRDGVIYSILLGEQVSVSSIEEKACVFNNSSFFNAYLQTPEPCVLLQGISH